LRSSGSCEQARREGQHLGRSDGARGRERGTHQLVVGCVLLVGALPRRLCDASDEVLVLGDGDEGLDRVGSALQGVRVDRALERARLAEADDEVVRDGADERLDRGSLLVLAAEERAQVVGADGPPQDGEVLRRLAAEDVERALHDVVVGAGCGRGATVSDGSTTLKRRG